MDTYTVQTNGVGDGMQRAHHEAAVSVLVCRGCCCGTERKLPEVDHAGHLDHLRDAIADNPASKLRTVDCLGPCSFANVVVVRRGTQRWWLGAVNEEEQIAHLGDWLRSPSSELPSELAALKINRHRLPNHRRLEPERGAALTERVAEAMTEGVWTIGVDGALAQFDTTTVELHRDRSTIVAVASGGAIRIGLDEHTRMFSFGEETAPQEPWAELLVRTGPVDEPAFVLTERGADQTAIDPAAVDDVLFDLGLGRRFMRFAIRTGDPELVSLLRSQCGSSWAEMPASVLDAVLESSPTRVVSTALGRIEVTNRGEDPSAHLDLDRLTVGEEWQEGFKVPTGWTSGIAHHLPNALPPSPTVQAVSVNVGGRRLQ